MKLTFIGAAHEVTGSCHLLQAVEKAAVNKTAASCISLIVFYPSTIR